MSSMWKINIAEHSFSADDFKELNLFAFGGNFGDLTSKTEEEIRILINRGIELNESQLFNFVNEIKIGDYLLFTESSKEEYLLGKVTSDYYFILESNYDGFYNFRNVDFLREIPINHLKDEAVLQINQCDNIAKIDSNSCENVLNVFFIDTPYIPEDYNLEEGLKLILNNYPKIRDLIVKEGYKTNDQDNLKSFIYNKFPKRTLIPLISGFGFNSGYKSFGSHHQGGFPPLAFLTIKYNANGYGGGSSDFYYVVYLFRGDFNGVYLTLGIGSDHLGNFDIDGFKEQIENECEDLLGVNEFNPYKINLYCDLVDDYNFPLADSYEKCTLFWKYYDFSDKKYFPRDDDLKNDLRDYLELYDCSLERCDFERFIID